MPTEIEKATAADVAVIAQVLGEIEEYYGGTNTPADPAQVRAALFGEHSAATVLLAREDNEVLGLAAIAMLWPAAGAESSLYLKELYVRSDVRRRGVGHALMTAARAEATAAGCGRLEWTADRDNPAAIAFYERLGFHPRGGKLFYRWEA